MNNRKKYIEIFVNSFQVNENELPTLHYQDVNSWDSIGHMKMIAELEETFNIMIEIADVLDFSSFLKGVDIMKKYGIEI
jgi:acyl carrier protein